VASGAKTDRAQLRRVLDQLNAGDVLLVTQLTVGIVPAEDADATHLRRWFTEGADIRDPFDAIDRKEPFDGDEPWTLLLRCAIGRCGSRFELSVLLGWNRAESGLKPKAVCLRVETAVEARPRKAGSKRPTPVQLSGWNH
jgi:hypothetical protein